MKEIREAWHVETEFLHLFLAAVSPFSGTLRTSAKKRLPETGAELLAHPDWEGVKAKTVAEVFAEIMHRHPDWEEELGSQQEALAPLYK